MGNTSDERTHETISEDHPHIHGEYGVGGENPRLYAGSPPHTWGIPVLIVLSSLPRRITPTYMGNTCINSFTNIHVGDHPHIHGEY